MVGDPKAKSNRGSVEINASCVPDPARPHTQLVLLGDLLHALTPKTG